MDICDQNLNNLQWNFLCLFLFFKLIHTHSSTIHKTPTFYCRQCLLFIKTITIKYNWFIGWIIDCLSIIIYSTKRMDFLSLPLRFSLPFRGPHSYTPPCVLRLSAFEGREPPLSSPPLHPVDRLRPSSPLLLANLFTRGALLLQIWGTEEGKGVGRISPEIDFFPGFF